MGSHLKGQHGDDRACTAKQRPLAAAPEPPSPVNVPYSGFYLNGSELTALKCKNMVSTSEDVISDLEAISQGKGFVSKHSNRIHSKSEYLESSLLGTPPSLSSH